MNCLGGELKAADITYYEAYKNSDITKRVAYSVAKPYCSFYITILILPNPFLITVLVQELKMQILLPNLFILLA